MIWFDICLFAITLLLLVPVLVLLFQVSAARLTRLEVDGYPYPDVRVAVLVPAHNEAAVIVDTLTALQPQMREGDRILVVADNCTDETAEIVRSMGVEVVERSHSELRGKGYALDFGVRHLESSPPDVLVVVDADCKVAEGSLAQLVSACVAENRPAQALYLMKAPPGAGLKLRMAEFAWCVKNLVRPLGWHRLGLPCQLMGTGMAFPWALASRMALANSNIVEDMKLGIDLAMDGMPPLFCPQALVTSEFPSAEKAVRSQRKRWEHGHLGIIVHEGPRLFRHALIRADRRLMGLALDLTVPPLALLGIMLFVVVMQAGVWVFLTGSAGPLKLAVFSCAAFGIAVMLAWRGWGRQSVSFAELMSVPGYVLGKIPLYLGFLIRRQKEWVRTDRQ